MAIVEFLVVLALLAAVVWLVSGPLRSGREAAAREEAELADLETAKETKYREIREAELDYRTGKLSKADWTAFDRQLRAEAVDILRRLDAAGGGPPAAADAPPEAAPDAAEAPPDAAPDAAEAPPDAGAASIPEPWSSSSPSSKSSSPSS
jgi:hypothetical protein